MVAIGIYALDASGFQKTPTTPSDKKRRLKYNIYETSKKYCEISALYKSNKIRSL